MKPSPELKALAIGLIVSVFVMGFSFGAETFLRGTAAPAAQPQAVTTTNKTEISLGSNSAQTGRALYLKNCAHCHAEDATGDEGPDLHNLEKSDAWISKRIRNGIKGEMTAFGGKFSQQDIDSLIAYLRTLK